MSLKYLEEYSSQSSVKVYRAALRKFFRAIYNEEKPNLEELAKRYFSEKRDYEKDVQTFFVAIKDSPPKTRESYLTAIKVFLLENHVELSQLFWRRLRRKIKGSRPISEEKVPKVEELRSIMMHLPVQGKALYLLLLSSGMRIGEALKLTLNDINLNADPPIINIRAEYTKTGERRITFISSEAKEALLEWLKIREKYLKSAVEKTPKTVKTKEGEEVEVIKNKEDPRIFPFTYENAIYIWRNALLKTGNGKIDPRTKRLLMHPHVLRKFFRAMLGKQSIDMAEALMGHHSYLSETYRRYPEPEKTLAEFYKQNEHLLLVFTRADEISKLRAEVEERNKQLQLIVNGLTAENLSLKEQINNLTKTLQELKSRMDRYEAFTRKFLEATPEELEELGRAIIGKKLQNFNKQLNEEP